MSNLISHSLILCLFTRFLSYPLYFNSTIYSFINKWFLSTCSCYMHEPWGKILLLPWDMKLFPQVTLGSPELGAAGKGSALVRTVIAQSGQFRAAMWIWSQMSMCLLWHYASYSHSVYCKKEYNMCLAGNMQYKRDNRNFLLLLLPLCCPLSACKQDCLFKKGI